MTRTDQWKLGGVLVATALSVWFLVPSCRYYFYKSHEPLAGQPGTMSPKDLGALGSKSLQLGLDLQGGMHLVLEVDRTGLSPEQARSAPERAMEIIRNRVDQFGVTEPLVQREGEDRIVIQLPGLTDRQRAIDLIGRTARLEFKLVRTPQEVKTVFDRLDAYLAARGVGAGPDTARSRAPLTSHFLTLGSSVFIRNDDLPAVQKLLATAGVDSMVPSDSQLLWGRPDESRDEVVGRELYVMKREAEMTGGSVASAEPQVGLETTDPSAWGVSMKMTPQGRYDFARITGNNVGRQLAIVLDSVVSSAPVIKGPIPSGDASITGSFNDNSAKDLAVVLRAGALPAPVRIIEERSVGPSLGSDSIRDGLFAGLVGTILVIVFMAVYYRLSGLIAITALALNILYLLAAMVGVPIMLGGRPGTLTLPGIAGIVLTVGMAVDANVLIFERIREELRNQRSVRQSVELGYNRAFRTILDSNLTTLISALFLFQFGTGPIKGFAVTLSIGLIANMFTAVLFTRMIFDFMLGRAKIERLSI